MRVTFKYTFIAQINEKFIQKKTMLKMFTVCCELVIVDGEKRRLGSWEAGRLKRLEVGKMRGWEGGW